MDGSMVELERQNWTEINPAHIRDSVKTAKYFRVLRYCCDFND